MNWPWQAARCSPSFSPTPLQQDRQAKWEKSLRVKIKTGRSLPNYHHGQTRFDMRKISLIYWQLKIEWDGEKQTQKLKHVPSAPLHPSQAQLYSLSPNSSTSSPEPRSTGWKGNGACGQSITIPLCFSFVLTLLPCSGVGPLHWLHSMINLLQHELSPRLQIPSVHIHLVQCRVLHGLQFANICSCMVLSVGCGEIPAARWCLLGIQGNLCSCTWSTSFLLLSPQCCRADS